MLTESLAAHPSATNTTQQVSMKLHQNTSSWKLEQDWSCLYPDDIRRFGVLQAYIHVCVASNNCIAVPQCQEPGEDGSAWGRPRFLARWLTLVMSACRRRPCSSQCSLSSAHAYPYLAAGTSHAMSAEHRSARYILMLGLISPEKHWICRGGLQHIHVCERMKVQRAVSCLLLSLRYYIQKRTMCKRC